MEVRDDNVWAKLLGNAEGILRSRVLCDDLPRACMGERVNNSHPEQRVRVNDCEPDGTHGSSSEGAS
jgi:hypothetical protein